MYGWRRRGVFVAYVQVADGGGAGLDGRCGSSFAMFGGGDVGVWMYTCMHVGVYACVGVGACMGLLCAFWVF